MPSGKERFDAVVRLLEREDTLTNSRMTWYMQVQGFLIAAGTFLCAEKSNLASLRDPAIILLSLACIAISTFVYVSVCRARDAKKQVCNTWENWKARHIVSPQWFPEPGGDNSWRRRLTPGQAVPVVFIVFWWAVLLWASRQFPTMGWVCWFLPIIVFVLVLVTLIAALFFGSLGRSTVSPRFHGVVYDLDGTIIDSQAVHMGAWKVAAAQWGVPIPEGFAEYQKGKTNEKAAKYLLEPVNRMDILDDFVRAKIEHANQHAAECICRDDFSATHKRLCRLGIKVGVCTSAPKEFCQKVYAANPELKELADRTVWREKYSTEKTEGLAKAINEIGCRPDDVVYVGDAASDWEAANAVGCEYVRYEGLAIGRHSDLLGLLS